MIASLAQDPHSFHVVVYISWVGALGTHFLCLPTVPVSCWALQWRRQF